MIRYREKQFFLPLLLEGASIGSSLLDYSATKKAEEGNNENAERQEELMKEQNRKLEMISERAKSNPQVAGDVQSVLQKSPVTEHFYSLINANTLKNAKLFAKDLVGIAGKHKDKVAGFVLSGAGMGAAGYAANKYIQHDMKKNNLEGAMIGEDPQQKAYAISTGSIMQGVKKAGGFAKKTLAKNWKSSLGWGLGLTAAPAILQYQADKSAIKDQINSTNKPVSPEQEQQRSYSLMTKGSSILKGIQGGLKTLKSHPGKTILGGVSNLTFGGGKAGVKTVAGEMANGQSSWTRKIASKMTTVGKNGEVLPTKMALAASIPVGVGLMSTMNMGQKAVEGTARKLDPNAYKYQDAKNQQVQ